MRIPKIGMDVLFVLQAASPEDQRPAELRPAKIVRVWNYNTNTCTVNLMVFLDGKNDTDMVLKLNLGVPESGILWITSANYDPNGQTGSFSWINHQEHQIVTFKVRAPITHGRESIAAGAEGSYDELKQTISFNRQDVTGMHSDDSPIYPALSFMDQHCARLDAPEGFQWTNVRVPTDPNKERAGERQHMMNAIEDERQEMIADRFGELFDIFCDRLGLPPFPHRIRGYSLDNNPLRQVPRIPSRAAQREIGQTNHSRKLAMDERQNNTADDDAVREEKRETVTAD